MRALVSWLRDLVEIPDGVSIDALAQGLHMAGFELAAVEPVTPTDRSGQTRDHAPSDAVIDVEITANRPDCLSMIGLAREVSALHDVPLRGTALAFQGALPLTPRPPLPLGERGRGGEGEKARLLEVLASAPNSHEASGLRVTIEEPALCPRYSAAVADIRIAPSPAWLSARLAAAGIRSINNIVDITNYVLIETGHPLHAFDLERLGGRHLRIRRAAPGETVKTLDGQDRTLGDDMLVIADATRAQAVAGVMGGADSEVSESTGVIALESAYFAPSSVRRTSKQLGLSTQASYRFERGADPEAPPRALARACALIEEIGAGTVRPEWIDARATTRTPTVITLRHEQIGRLLGFVVPPADCARILTRLGFELSLTTGAQPPAHEVDPTRSPITRATPSGSTVATPDDDALTSAVAEARRLGRSPVWNVTVPSWRVDVTREVDLIEDVARQYGYDHIPTTFPALKTMPPSPDARLQRDRAVRQFLRSAGFHEAATLAFIERAAALAFAEERALVAILNPLSEKFAVLRPSLLPGLVDSLAHNRRREQRDVRLFEIANAFTRAEGERRRVACVWTGHATTPHWSGSGRLADVYDVSGVATALCAALGLDATFAPATRPYLSPSSSVAVHARARAGDTNGGPAAREIGVIGQLLPEVADARGIPPNEPVFVGEIDLDAVVEWTTLGERLTVRPLPRHPSVVRDVSISINADLPAAQVRDTIRAAAAASLEGPISLEGIVEFDRYQGKGVAEGQCSLSLRLTFRAPDRTLTDAEVQAAMDRIVAALAAEHGATLR